MTPQESGDLDVAPVGVCEECRQEQLLRRRVVVDLSRGGIGMTPKYLLECGCGVHEIERPPRTMGGKVKRDLDLMREILLRAEEAGYNELSVQAFTAEDPRRVAEHFLLLEEAGLVEANLFRTDEWGVQGGNILRLTNSGHDFLESIQNEDVWRRTKAHVAEKAGGVPLAIIAAVAKAYVLELLGLTSGD